MSLLKLKIVSKILPTNVSHEICQVRKPDMNEYNYIKFNLVCLVSLRQYKISIFKIQ